MPGEVVAAVEINTIANAVYAHNHPDTKLLNNNIQRFTAKEINKMNVNTILMSPPCQPFTRVGNKKDINDARTNALVHICNILHQLNTIDFILMENVKGFEVSQARDMYVAALKKSNFEYQEMILSPTEIGVPNTRYRYYCLARRARPFSFKCDEILERLPEEQQKEPLVTIGGFIGDTNVPDEFLLSDDILGKRVWLLDIVHPETQNTICFTKAYTHYSEGTGSVYCPLAKAEGDKVFEEIKKNPTWSTDQQLAALKTLRLRYFMPTEVAKLMSFPKHFTFPKDITNRQRYRLLGNSINVALVGKLIKILCDS